MAFTNSGSEAELPRTLLTLGVWMDNSSRTENLLSYQFAPCSSSPINRWCFSASLCLHRGCHFLMVCASKPPAPAAEAAGAGETSSSIGFISLNLLTHYDSLLPPRTQAWIWGGGARRAWQHQVLCSVHNNPSVLMLPIIPEHDKGSWNAFFKCNHR